MKILVTGANGFVGRAVCNHLCIQGHEVFGLRRQFDNECSSSSIKISWVYADIFSPEIHKILKEHHFEGLIHLAWITDTKEYWVSNKNISWVSCTLDLLESFRMYGGRRVVLAGSSAEYSWGTQDCFKEDSTEYNPQGLYGTCKLGLKNIVESWATQNNISWGWGRIFNIFGPFENPYKLIPRTINKMLNNEKLSFDNGSIVRDFMHIDDTGKAFSLLFNSNFCGVVNIASGIPVKVRDLLELIAKILCKESFLEFSVQDLSVDTPKKIIADVTTLNHCLNFTQAYSLEEGLRDTCFWWKRFL